MIRLCQFFMLSIIATFSLIVSPVYAASTAAEAIAQAEQDLKSAASSGAVWRIVDKASGSGAIGIDKLLKLARKELDKGDNNEAKRLATRVSWAAQLGIIQANEQKPAKPFY